MTRDRTVPSPTPASNMRMAGGAGWMLASSSETRLAISVFSLQVETNRRYFCLLSKNRLGHSALNFPALSALFGLLRLTNAVLGVNRRGTLTLDRRPRLTPFWRR